MSSVLPAATPADVLSFAAQNQVQAYLDPLRHLTRRLFPTASSLRVTLEDDPEIPNDWHIVFEVHVSPVDVPDYRAAKRLWRDEFRKIYSDPLCLFRLILLRTD